MSSSPPGGPLLAAQSLSLARGGRQLFQNLSIEVRAGELWQIEGPNGAGKTSLIRILCGLSRYGYEGEVQRLSPLLYIGHQAAVKALMSPRENLKLHVSGAKECSDEDIEAALTRVGLYGYEDVPSHTLSAGQHRRVNLARLYLTDTALWLLDEPFTAIDADGVKSLESLFDSHIEQGGAVVTISHQKLSVQCGVSVLDLSLGVAL